MWFCCKWRALDCFILNFLYDIVYLCFFMCHLLKKQEVHFTWVCNKILFRLHNFAVYSFQLFISVRCRPEIINFSYSSDAVSVKIILASCVSVFSSQWETNIGFSPWLKKELFFFQGAHKHYSDCILIKHESEFCVKRETRNTLLFCALWH